MRSYKESLLEYLEEQQFTALTKDWYAYLKNALSLNTTNFQTLLSYPPIQCETELEEYFNQISSPYLANLYYFISSKKINEISTKLIHRIECLEDGLLPQYGIEDVKGWLEFKSRQKMQAIAFNYMESLQEFVDGQKKTNVVLNLSEESKLRIDFINEYYSQRHNERIVRRNVTEETTIEEVKLNFSSQSVSDVDVDKAFWTDEVFEEGVPFFMSDQNLFELNQKAKLADIKVEGVVKRFQKLNVEPQYTSDLELFKAVLYDHKSSMGDIFEYEELNELKSTINHSMQSFYSISEFDYTLEIDNDFSDEEVESLRNISFSCFPFYFSNKVEHFKWVERTAEGKLKIKVQSKRPQTILVGAEIKKLKE